MRQGDTLSLTSDYAFYDGDNQMAEARHNVLLRHRGTKLYTDSLNYDRLYNIGYFFEGGKMVDRNNVLVSDWGEYDTETRKVQTGIEQQPTVFYARSDILISCLLYSSNILMMLRYFTQPLYSKLQLRYASSMWMYVVLIFFCIHSFR